MKLTSVGKSAYFKGDGGSFLRLLFTLHCLLLVSVASLSWSPGGARNAQCYQNLLILFGHVFLNSSHFSATEIVMQKYVAYWQLCGCNRDCNTSVSIITYNKSNEAVEYRNGCLDKVRSHFILLLKSEASIIYEVNSKSMQRISVKNILETNFWNDVFMLNLGVVQHFFWLAQEVHEFHMITR